MKNTLQKMIGTAVLGTALALPIAGNANDVKVEMPAQVQEKIELDAPVAKLKPFGFIDTRFADSYNPSVGFKIGKGWVNQSLIVGGLENVFTEGDALSGFTWLNTDFGYGVPNVETLVEQDFGINYDFPIMKVENGPKLLQGKLTLNLGGQYWKYWGGQLGEHDYVFDSGLTWSGVIDFKVLNRHLFPHTGVKEGNYVSLELSKRLNLGSKGDYSFSFTPSVNSTWSDDFFQEGDGWTVVQTIGKLEVSKGKNSAYVAGGHQFNIDGDTRNKPSKPIVYLGLSRAF
ncbi:MAG: hypothetical protein Q8Q31_04265 [Nanoarchaeota archaeon]|nr:hypothetical protein [Nanoarchaeota archaeon]